MKIKVPKLNFTILPNFLKQQQKTNLYLEKYKNVPEKDNFGSCYGEIFA
jgi:hypothetical protein